MSNDAVTSLRKFIGSKLKKKLPKHMQERVDRITARSVRVLDRTGLDHTQAVAINRLDAIAFKIRAQEAPALYRVMEDGVQAGHPHFADLVTDIYQSLFLPEPKLRGAKDLKRSHRPHVEMMEVVQHLDAYGQAREQTVFNDGASIIATIALAKELLNVPEQPEGEPEPDPSGLQQLMQQLAQQLPKPEAGDDDADSGDEGDEESEEGEGTPQESGSNGSDQAGGDQAGEEGQAGGQTGGQGGNQAGHDPGDGDAGSQPGPSDHTSDDGHAKHDDEWSGEWDNGAARGDQSDEDSDESDSDADETGDDQTDGQRGPRGQGGAMAEPSGLSTGGATSQGGTGSGLSDEEIAEIAETLDQLEAELAEHERDDPEIDEDAIRRAARRGLKQADQETSELAEALQAWGSGAGEWNTLPLNDRLEMAARLRNQPTLKKFAFEIGRMRHEALDARLTPGAKEREEMVDITTGGSFANMIASERVYLAHEKLRPILYMKMLRDQLLEREYAGRNPAGKGPMICLLDSSGSMSAHKDRWAKAVALALLEIAKAEERDYACIFFDDEIQRQFVFSRGNAPLRDKLELATFFTGGGTSFDEPLSLGLRMVEEAQGEWKHADIVMITDGISRLSDEFLADYNRRAEAIGLRTHGVLIDSPDAWLNELKKFSTQVYPVSSLQSDHLSARPLFLRTA